MHHPLDYIIEMNDRRIAQLKKAQQELEHIEKQSKRLDRNFLIFSRIWAIGLTVLIIMVSL